jgi:cell division protein FtsI (penicillin-binding protein 3)
MLLRGNQQMIVQACKLIGRTNVRIQGEPLAAGRVPNCHGMSAKDAIELLHSAGLKVRLSGYGKVSSQSPSAGSPIKKGTTVVINLK